VISDDQPGPHPAAFVPTVERQPVLLPTMSLAQTDAWQVLVAFDIRLTVPWVLVGGQMTMLHCLEHGIPQYRATDDGDIVCDVWTRRTGLREVTGLLGSWRFEPTPTSDRNDYRYTRGSMTFDVMLPEYLERQDRQPVRAHGRRGLSIEGGNQAVRRAERVPVSLGGVTGFVRRPSLLGALVIKAAAIVADTRDPQRHQEDFALLGLAALTSGLRALREQLGGHDQPRLRAALIATPPEHRAWRRIPDPSDRTAVRNALTRLADPGR